MTTPHDLRLVRDLCVQATLLLLSASEFVGPRRPPLRLSRSVCGPFFTYSVLGQVLFSCTLAELSLGLLSLSEAGDTLALLNL